MLDPIIADMQSRLAEAGLSDLYRDGTNGPEARARAERARAEFHPRPDLPTGKILERTIPGKGGGIPVRIVWPASGTATATVVYFHGGGWVLGDLDSHSAHAIRLANRAGAVVVNVDYRLAPEHRFPAAVDDAFSALQWAADNISELGGDPTKLAVAGDSAGGNLAAAAAIYARDTGIKLAAQLLIYAATDIVGAKSVPSRTYLGSEADRLSRDWRASPAQASSHRDLAPAIIAIGHQDWLVEKTAAYVKLLRDADIPLLLREFPTLGHGFFSHTSISKVSEDAANLICDDLASILNRKD